MASSKPILAGGLKYVYFLDLFFNKKEKEQKVSLWRFCRNTGAGSFQEPEGWGVQRSWQFHLHSEPREAQGTLASAQALAAGRWKEIMEETNVYKTGFCELSPHLVE